jgi:hypothetical protein
MNCPACGTPVEKDAPFCPKCYARIEPPSLWLRFLRLFQTTGKPRRPVITIKKTVSIKTTDKDGQRHDYHSMEELPPELRAEIEKMESEAVKEGLSSSSSSSNDVTTKIVRKRTYSVFKVKDASGNEQVYHSLDELPSEIRAALEKAQQKTDE